MNISISKILTIVLYLLSVTIFSYTLYDYNLTRSNYNYAILETCEIEKKWEIFLKMSQQIQIVKQKIKRLDSCTDLDTLIRNITINPEEALQHKLDRIRYMYTKQDCYCGGGSLFFDKPYFVFDMMDSTILFTQHTEYGYCQYNEFEIFGKKYLSQDENVFKVPKEDRDFEIIAREISLDFENMKFDTCLTKRIINPSKFSSELSNKHL